MKLKLLRFLETLFSIPAVYFGALADNIDVELHKQLYKAMKDIESRELKPNNQQTEPR